MMSVLMAWSIAAALAYLAAALAVLVVLAVRLGGFREDPAADHDAMSASRFTIPVSLIVPVGPGTDSGELDRTIAALLGLNYPKFEVIVVADGPSAPDALAVSWDLEAREVFYRAALATAPVRMMYRSSRDGRLLVVHKSVAGVADALNCGVNLARFRYVAAVEPGVTFDEDALLRALTAPLRDPATVVGATSHVEIVGDALQQLRSIRSLMQSRLIWRTAPAALAPLDAVVVWRRDAVAQAGGFSSAAADPQLEMMVTLQSAAAAGLRRPVVRTADTFGYRTPLPFVDVLRKIARRQIAALQTVASLMATDDRPRAMLAHFAAAEFLTSFAQAWVVMATAAGAAASWWSWGNVALAFVLLAFGQAVVSCAALLLRGSLSCAPNRRALRRLLMWAPMELVVFGPVAACARAAGIAVFLGTMRSPQPVAVSRRSPAV